MNEVIEQAANEVLAKAGEATHHDILRLAKALRAGKEEGALPEVECPVRHFFVPGLYGRECFLPAGSCVIGRVHTQACINVILGDVTVVNPAQPELGRHRYTGCETFTSPAGSMRACFAHADTWWTTFHPNPDNETDVEKVLARLSVNPDDTEAFERLVGAAPKEIAQ